VVYYDTIDQARRDGYRACQKCKPDDVAFYGQREEVVVKALEILRSKQNDGTMKSSLKEDDGDYCWGVHEAV
jgi:methylphosphotriester-DNA--protein-cysteine methyltransferase